MRRQKASAESASVYAAASFILFAFAYFGFAFVAAHSGTAVTALSKGAAASVSNQTHLKILFDSSCSSNAYCPCTDSWCYSDNGNAQYAYCHPAPLAPR